MIDYVMGSGKTKEKIREIRVSDRAELDHQLIEVRLKGKEKWRAEEKRNKRGWRGIWDEEGQKKFREKLGKLEMKGKKIGEEWKEMEKRINRLLREMEG